MTNDKIKQILDMLNNLQENFLSLPDDMLLNIDPRDNESIDQGAEFIKEYNDTLDQFIRISSQIESQIKNHFGINPEEEEVEKEAVNRKRRNRIIKELDKSQTHTLHENFTFKRPFGFILGDSAYKGLKTWKSLYMQVLKELDEKDSRLFSRLPQEDKFISRRGNPLFSRNRDDLRVGEKVNSQIYAEINMSANGIRDTITDLLKYFQIDLTSMRIYLREDRDASGGN